MIVCREEVLGLVDACLVDACLVEDGLVEDGLEVEAFLLDALRFCGLAFLDAELDARLAEAPPLEALWRIR